MTLPLTIRNVEKSIDDFKLKINELSFEEGTITAVIGTNGAGKSTFFKMMMNLVKQDSGDIDVFGKSVNGEDESWKQLVAYQAQTLIGCDPFTGEQLRKLMAELYPSWDEQLFRRFCEKLRIPLNKKVHKLSPGVRTKLNLALNIGKNTSLLILDEPTAAMDIPSRNDFLQFLLELMESGDKTILIASHQADDIKKLADYLVFIQNGEVTKMLEKDSLIFSYRLFWLKEEPPVSRIPGEIKRTYKKVILSNQPDKTLDYLTTHNLAIADEQIPTLEDIIHEVLMEGEMINV
ncbi:ATP-binding cassette domain-containing protein [Jeotgalibacillus proteolyticus]|uniref:ABC transporter ATP-binding protein n=1 Tax=Jeotgalibacillus proteolyticus TaxID=2082395 RepID=A0A2S5GDR4_9BACL|nr:ABC transporter ATP-binding protein [Jeotgalibacillus proteolyticus]PPA71098.1 ABC transporter ATP-binding protein [Jeotgalibacillus proteolyticus]